MTRKKFYLAFLLILGLLVFAACANYDGVPNRVPNDRILDNNDIRNNSGINGSDLNRGGAGNNWNTAPGDLGNSNLNR